MKKYPTYKDSGIESVGKIPEHWYLTKFKKTFVKIKDGTHGTFNSTNSGRPLLSAKNVFNDGIRISDNERLISEEDYNEIVKNGFPQKNDLLVTCVGTIGRTLVYNKQEPIAFQRSVAFIRFNLTKAVPYYYKYFVESSIYQDILASLAKTSAQSGVYMSDIANSICLLPPPEEQTQIAKYLDRKTQQIDDLIAKKERLIELLEEERTALINQAVTKGLDPNAPMKDSGIDWLGEIPEHWNVSRMNFLSSKIGDGLHGTPNYVELSDYPFINGNNIGSGVIEINDRTKFVDKSQFEKYKKPLTDNTILMSINGTIGNLAFYDRQSIILGKSVAYINLNEDVNKNYIFYFLSSKSATDYISKELSGSTIKNLSLYSINKTIVPYPPSKEQEAIVNYLKTKTSEIKDMMIKAKEEINLLKEYKSTLISEVVTGKIDVRDKVLTETV